MIVGYAYNDRLILIVRWRALDSLCEPLLLNAAIYTRTHFPVEHGLLLYDRWLKFIRPVVLPFLIRNWWAVVTLWLKKTALSNTLYLRINFNPYPHLQRLPPIVDGSAVRVAVDGAHCIEGKGRLKKRLDREGEKGCDAMGAWSFQWSFPLLGPLQSCSWIKIGQSFVGTLPIRLCVTRFSVLGTSRLVGEYKTR